MEVKIWTEKELAQVVEVRHQLHRQPELGHQERETTRLLRQELVRCGARLIHEDMASGAVAVIEGALPGGRTVALREDIDALPIQEETGLPFASRVPGVFHACGHDIHAAALLGCCRVLAAHRDCFAGRVIFIFQCAEETCDGAATMLKQGLLAGDAPDVLLGFHCEPGLPLGQVGIRWGADNASCDFIHLKVVGRGGHGARPEECVDPVLVSAYLLTQLQTIVSRICSPQQPVVLTFGQILGGSAPNIIPDSVELHGTLRTQDNSVRREMLRRIEEMSRLSCQTQGARCEVTFDRGVPALINSPWVCDRVLKRLTEQYGPEKAVRIDRPSMVSDDFAALLEAWGGQGAQLLLGTAMPGQPNTALGLHTPRTIFPDDALEPGVELLVHLALEFLAD